MQTHSQTTVVTTEPPAFLSVPDACRLTSLCRSAVYELIQTGRVKSFSVRVKGNIRGRRLVSRESLMAYIERHEDRPGTVVCG